MIGLRIIEHRRSNHRGELAPSPRQHRSRCTPGVLRIDLLSCLADFDRAERSDRADRSLKRAPDLIYARLFSSSIEVPFTEDPSGGTCTARSSIRFQVLARPIFVSICRTLNSPALRMRAARIAHCIWRIGREQHGPLVTHQPRYVFSPG